MNFDIKNYAEPVVDPAELAALGEGEMAYVKPMQSDEVARLFPQAPKLQPGMQLFALAFRQRRAHPADRQPRRGGRQCLGA